MSYESRLCETPVHPRTVLFVEAAKEAVKKVPRMTMAERYECPLCKGKATAYEDFEGKIHVKCNDCTMSINYDPSKDDEIFRRNEIVKARYTRKINDHDYSELICTFTYGEPRTFHFHASNPMPREYVVEGLTWDELRGMAQGMWRMALGECVTLKAKEESK